MEHQPVLFRDDYLLNLIREHRPVKFFQSQYPAAGCLQPPVRQVLAGTFPSLPPGAAYPVDITVLAEPAVPLATVAALDLMGEAGHALP